MTSLSNVNPPAISYKLEFTLVMTIYKFLAASNSNMTVLGAVDRFLFQTMMQSIFWGAENLKKLRTEHKSTESREKFFNR